MSDEQKQNDNGLGSPELPPLDGEFIAAEGEQPQQEQQGAGLAELLSMLGVSVCSFIASRKGEHWNMTPIEAQNFGQAADKVAGMYIKDGQLSPWLGLAVVVGAFAVPRMAVDAIIAKEKQKQQQAQTNGEPGQN